MSAKDYDDAAEAEINGRGEERWAYRERNEIPVRSLVMAMRYRENGKRAYIKNGLMEKMSLCIHNRPM